jgi:hypothetical protein
VRCAAVVAPGGDLIHPGGETVDVVGHTTQLRCVRARTVRVDLTRELTAG